MYLYTDEMILRSNKNTTNITNPVHSLHDNRQSDCASTDKMFEKKICALMERYDKRLVRLEYALKQISQALNVEQESSETMFLKNDVTSEGWLHEYTYGSRVYHAGYHGHVIKETRLRVIFRTMIDGKEFALSVSKSDVGRVGQFNL